MRIVCAGCDSVRFTHTVLAADHPYFLTSYFNAIRGKADVSQFVRVYQSILARGGWWIMDSGLFSMMFGAEKHRIFSESDLVAYARQYLRDMKGIGYVSTVVEMDVHKVLGMEALARMRRLFEAEWDPERTIYVWHFEEGQAGWDELVKRYPYVAISLPELRKITQAGHLKTAVKSMLIRAQQARPGVRVHLLGCTQPDLMMQGGYYSCDSTSWMMAGKYSRGTVYRHGGMFACSTYDAVFKSWVKKNAPVVNSRLVSIDPEYGQLTEAQKNYIFANAANVISTRLFNEHVNRVHYDNEAIPTLWR